MNASVFDEIIPAVEERIKLLKEEGLGAPNQLLRCANDACQVEIDIKRNI